ncbi:glycosyltransferase [Candidatus Actinomarina]|jgi:glycosyltransferase involved in cell wall biosynthesis|nr:glycosyltransferase [Candidatus Actinomarina sp.]
MSSPKLISVLMSVYNSEKSLDESIESIINQTYSNFELLLIDDGSTDKSWEILQKYKQNTKIRIFQNPKNIGLTKSLNILLKHAKGFYIARHDADDTSDLQRLKKQELFIRENNLQACTSRAEIKDSKKIIPGLSYYIPLKYVVKYKNPFIHGTLLVEKSTLDDLNGYDEKYYYAQDYKLMTELLEKKYKLKIMKDNLYSLNMKNNISTEKVEEQNYYAECVRKKIDPKYISQYE